MKAQSTKKNTRDEGCPRTVKKPHALGFYRRYAAEGITGSVHAGDALEFMRSLQPQSARIVFLDPPFNLGKAYGGRGRASDLRPEAEYEQWLLQVLDESVRVLDQGGTLYLYHLPIWAMRLGAHLEKKLDFRHWIAISMKNGFVRGKRLYPAHYSLLMLTKGEPTVLNRPKTAPVECRHCGKYIKDYGGYKSIIEEKGINLSDFWEDVSPVRHAQRKNRVANELPQIIFDRVMQISSEAGALYLDPFAGSGGGVLSAAAAGMRFAACDIVPSNCQLIVKRLGALKGAGSLNRVPVAVRANLADTTLEAQALIHKGA
jgi:site-specific DNA-methyltransferase (adenine-specific)